MNIGNIYNIEKNDISINCPEKKKITNINSLMFNFRYCSFCIVTARNKEYRIQLQDRSYCFFIISYTILGHYDSVIFRNENQNIRNECFCDNIVL